MFSFFPHLLSFSHETKNDSSFISSCYIEENLSCGSFMKEKSWENCLMWEFLMEVWHLSLERVIQIRSLEVIFCIFSKKKKKKQKCLLMWGLFRTIWCNIYTLVCSLFCFVPSPHHYCSLSLVFRLALS